MICNYLFFKENERVYIYDFEEIGVCVFIIRDRGCDFVVIEIKEFYLDLCDVVFRRDDKKKINVNVYFDSLENVNIVYKIGVIMDVINGIIVSFEFYFKVIDEFIWENVFFVKGIVKKFFERGDSGLLVFCRLNCIK